MRLDVLDMVADALGFLPHATSAEERNLLRFPEGKPPKVVHGTLAHSEGGLVTDLTLRGRVSVIMGPGATLRGAADELLAFFTAAIGPPDAPDPPSQAELARALFVYNRSYLPGSSMASFRVGLRLPVPIEIDPTTGEWVVNAGRVRLWSLSFDPADRRKLDQPVTALTWPEHGDLAQEAAQLRQAATDPQSGELSATTLAIALMGQMASNPFAHVLVACEVLAQLDPAQRVALALALPDAMREHQLALLATLTAGGAFLRMLARRLAAPPSNLPPAQQAALPAAIAKLDAALWEGPPSARRPVSRRELPEAASQLRSRGKLPSRITTESAGGHHRLVLGRDVAIGSVDSCLVDGECWRGASYTGWHTVDDFIRDNALALNPSGDARTAARLRVVGRIAPNEAQLDGVRMQDKAMLSVGLQQWSAHIGDELPELLSRFKTVSEDEYDLYFGIHGLDVQPQASHPGQYDLLDTRGGAKGVPLVFDDHHHMNCSLFRFFDGWVDVQGAGNFGTTWAGRARAAALGSHRYRIAQVEFAIARFERIEKAIPTLHVRGTADSGVTAFSDEPLRDVVDSDFGAALILDQHINKPNYTPKDLRTAATTRPVKANADLRDRAICDRYHDIRRTFDTTARNAVIDGAPTVDRAHGSFGGWPAPPP